MRKRDLIAAAVGALAATVITVGFAYAEGGIPGPDGVIQGCYDSGGNLKVVASLPCPRGYNNSLAWAVRGPQGAQGPPGKDGTNAVSCTGGQNAVSAYGTKQLHLGEEDFSFVPVPGLAMTVNVPDDCVLYISTDGGLLTTGNIANGGSVVEVAVRIDGSTVPHAGLRTVYAVSSANFPGVSANWSMAVTAVLAPGLHTIDVVARRLGGANESFGAIVSGGTNEGLQGSLNVLTIAN